MKIQQRITQFQFQGNNSQVGHGAVYMDAALSDSEFQVHLRRRRSLILVSSRIFARGWRRSTVILLVLQALNDLPQ